MTDGLRLILFDCDGTLIDSQHMIVAAMEHAFSTQGLAALPREKVLSIVGLSLKEAIASLLPETEEEARNQVTNAYRDAFFHLRRQPDLAEPVFAGMRELLTELHEIDDLLLGVVTGKSDRGLAHILEVHALEPFFTTLQTADRHPSKPHPSMVETAMRIVGVEPAQTIVIGDTTFDIEMAVAAGVEAFGVSWGYHPPHELHRAGARDVVDDAAALRAVLQHWAGLKGNA